MSAQLILRAKIFPVINRFHDHPNDNWGIEIFFQELKE